MRRKEQIIGWCSGWLPTLVAMSCVVASLITGEPIVGPFLLLVAGFFFCMVAGVVLHEMAHLISGSLLGLRPWCIQIGHGSILIHKEFGGLQIVLRQFPYSGMVCPGVPMEQFRWRSIASIAAGPLSNLALAVLILSFVAYHKINDTHLIPGIWEFLLWSGFVANVYVFIYSVGIEARGRGIPDGDLIRLLLKGVPPAATSTGQPGSESTHEVTKPGSYWPNQYMEPEIMLMALKHQLAQSIGSVEERCVALDQFVTIVLLHGTVKFLPEADRYSEELLRLLPTEWSMKGSRGSVLVEKGDLEAGIAMLLGVMEHSQNQFDHCISASFLGIAEIKRKNFDEAARWLIRSREIDPHCPSLLRAEKLMGEVNPLVKHSSITKTPHSCTDPQAGR